MPEVVWNFGHRRGNKKIWHAATTAKDKVSIFAGSLFVCPMDVDSEIPMPPASWRMWVEASCCTKINPHQTMITTLRIDDVSRPMDVTNTSPLREHQGSYQRIYSVQNKWISWLGNDVRDNLRWLYTSHAQSPLKSQSWSPSSSVANVDGVRHTAPCWSLVGLLLLLGCLLWLFARRRSWWLWCGFGRHCLLW